MCDFIAGPLVMMHSRFLHFDFTNPYMASPVMMLIPKPKMSLSHIDAIWKPFQPNVSIVFQHFQVNHHWIYERLTFYIAFKVWLVLLIILVTATIVLALLNQFSNRVENGDDGPPQSFSFLIKAYGLFVFQSITLRGLFVYIILTDLHAILH